MRTFKHLKVLASFGSVCHVNDHLPPPANDRRSWSGWLRTRIGTLRRLRLPRCASNRWGSRNTSGSRLAAVYHIITVSPVVIDLPYSLHVTGIWHSVRDTKRLYLKWYIYEFDQFVGSFGQP